MGKNKLGSKNPVNTGNPIYKRAGTGAPLKYKLKAKPVKMNLKKIKLANKEAIASLDKKVDNFRDALKTKPKTEDSKTDTTTQPPETEQSTPATVEDAMDAISKL
ncbi:hypothetical protein Pmani_019877 [Petrolisthes manimaculis]|uniref:Uncharacterized protein n=1 Tax=Petrolisthes manimaculis TaxID=1843537 RepID=A0AAE1PI22_9EUCA|nr:hypothetical protein Pmani_019877 [Petrolisthes manimaculis]